jgi:hypothetical protein
MTWSPTTIAVRAKPAAAASAGGLHADANKKVAHCRRLERGAVESTNYRRPNAVYVSEIIQATETRVGAGAGIRVAEMADATNPLGDDGLRALVQLSSASPNPNNPESARQPIRSGLS